MELCASPHSLWCVWRTKGGGADIAVQHFRPAEMCSCEGQTSRVSGMPQRKHAEERPRMWRGNGEKKWTCSDSIYAPSPPVRKCTCVTLSIFRREVDEVVVGAAEGRGTDDGGGGGLKGNGRVPGPCCDVARWPLAVGPSFPTSRHIHRCFQARSIFEACRRQCTQA